MLQKNWEKDVPGTNRTMFNAYGNNVAFALLINSGPQRIYLIFKGLKQSQAAFDTIKILFHYSKRMTIQNKTIVNAGIYSRGHSLVNAFQMLLVRFKEMTVKGDI